MANDANHTISVFSAEQLATGGSLVPQTFVSGPNTKLNAPTGLIFFPTIGIPTITPTPRPTTTPRAYGYSCADTVPYADAISYLVLQTDSNSYPDTDCVTITLNFLDTLAVATFSRTARGRLMKGYNQRIASLSSP